MDFGTAYMYVMIALSAILTIGAMIYDWYYGIEYQVAVALFLGLTVTLWPVMIPTIIIYFIIRKLFLKK